jgi:hypothetical protein
MFGWMTRAASRVVGVEASGQIVGVSDANGMVGAKEDVGEVAHRWPFDAGASLPCVFSGP